MDGLTDDYEHWHKDYECWHGELPEALHKGKTALYVLDLRNFQVGVSHVLHRKYWTEAASAESHGVVMLMSGAWKT